MSTKNNPTAFAKLCASVRAMAQRVIDGTDFTDKRLAAIEHRLAQLDGGDDAAAARRDALFNANVDRVSAGRDLLAMKIDPKTDTTQWTKS